MRSYLYEYAKLQDVVPPEEDSLLEKVQLTDDTVNQRFKKTLDAMTNSNLDVIVIYADLEHGSNFEYLSGFLPRFEEALLVLHRSGDLFYLLGNENMKLAPHALLKGTALQVPIFSLPNQPMHEDQPLSNLLIQAGIESHHNVGLVGWKLFTGKSNETTASKSACFDVPHFIVSALESVTSTGTLMNATHLFIGNNGIRRLNNANEIVHYAHGAQLASKAILQGLDSIALGKTEMTVASALDLYGQPKSVVAVAATGQRFERANLYPSSKTLRLADPFSMTIGYKGGLQSRSGYLCESESQLPPQCRDYLERVVKPYFTAVTAWIETIAIGMTGNAMYQLVESVLPQSSFGWCLNPGHLIATEEWMSSPIFPQSEEILSSGMMLQIDIIPSVPGYAGSSVECGVALADESLKRELSENYPEFYSQCIKRKHYLKESLGIQISEDVLVLSNAALYLRPLLLNKMQAMTYHR